MIKNCSLALLAVAILGQVHAADTPSQTTLYKSSGPDGRVVYGDRPPSDGRSSQTMKFESLPSSPLSPATLAYLEELKKGGATAQTSLATGELLLFTTNWCGYCKKARAYLASKGARYRDIDIETQAGAAAYAQAGGQRGVPLLFKNGQGVKGFSAAGYDSFLEGKN